MICDFIFKVPKMQIKLLKSRSIRYIIIGYIDNVAKTNTVHKIDER